MKLKKIFIILIILIMMSTYFPMVSRAEEEITPVEITTIETPNYTITDTYGQIGDIIVSNDEITMIAKTSTEDAEVIYSNEYRTIYSGLYSELYYTYNENLKELNKIDLKQYFTNKGIDLSDSLVKIKNIYKNNDTFYVEIIIDYVFNTTAGRYVKSKYMILEINNEINISQVVLPNNSTELEVTRYLPDSLEKSMWSQVYNEHFLLVGNQFEGLYYITEDFKRWEEKQIPVKIDDENYITTVIKFQDGVNFIINDKKSCSTADFVNYKVFDENYLLGKYYIWYGKNYFMAPVGGPLTGWLFGYKNSCFEEYKGATLSGFGMDAIRIEEGLCIECENLVFSARLPSDYGNKISGQFIVAVDTDTFNISYYYLGEYEDYDLTYVAWDNDIIYYLNESKNELLILDTKDCSKMKRVELPSGSYSKLEWEGDTNLLVIGEEETLIFDVNDFKEKTTISGLNINDVKVENVKRQLLNILNVIEGQILKIINYDGKEIETGSNVGTGTKVTVKNGDSEKEYTIVIYGDITGDGEINAVDALALIKGINNKVSFKSELHKEAGRILVGEGEEPTALDALAIVKAANNKYTINQSK